MRIKTLALAAASLAALGAAATASAQVDAQGRYGDRWSEARITLYELPDFRGRSVTLTGENTNLSSLGFNDRARSARVEGTWRVCEDANYRSRCETLDRDSRDLERDWRMGTRISSVQPIAGGGWGGGPGGGWGPPPGRPGGGGGWGGGDDWGRDSGVRGSFTTFYARPSFRGFDVAGGRANAEEFCRRQGHRGAVYGEMTERSRRVIDLAGRHTDNAPALRDVLCRN